MMQLLLSPVMKYSARQPAGGQVTRPLLRVWALYPRVSYHVNHVGRNVAHDIVAVVALVEHSKDVDRGVGLDLLYHLCCRS